MSMDLSGIGRHEIALASRISEAVAAELKASSRGIRFDVLGVSEDDGILTFVVESETALLDPAMEDGSIRWEGEYGGTAEIVSIDPDAFQIHAYLESGSLPRHISHIWINPPRYLEPLYKCWQSPTHVRAALSAHARLGAGTFTQALATDASAFPELRQNQRKAFSLTGYDVAFLWGPPGTGKTHTLGRLIAAHVVQHSARVLLVSATNVAVDQAILSIRDGLLRCGASMKSHPVYRFGSQFIPTRFEGDREALIPVRSRELVSEYRGVLNARPSPKKPAQYKLWRESLSAVRERIRQENLAFMTSARVAAVTATYAATKYSELCESGTFNLVVFDEASQVGKAHALMIAGLGRRLLFAGDPKQLSPIVQSQEENSQIWLGRSPFDWKDLSGAGNITLNEQSRMAPDICAVVSETFYDGQLIVAHDVDEGWHRERTLQLEDALGTRNVVFLAASIEASAMGRERRWRCPGSAEIVVRLLWALRSIVDLKNVVVLTPYRAQRAEICQQLKAAGLDEKIVSTIHRAQGSEKPVVVVDPVRPSSDFLNGPEGERLINVAISRAQARLFVLVHPDYNRQPTVLARIIGESSLLPPGSLPTTPVRITKPAIVQDPLKQVRNMPLPQPKTQLELRTQRRAQTPDSATVFEEALRKYLSSGARSPRDIKAFAADVRFSKVPYAERDRIIASFL